MPAAAVIVPAVAGIAGAVIQSRANSRATKAQENAAREAIAYEKEQQASRQSRYDAAYQDYRTRYDQWLEQFYGVKPKSGGDEVGSMSGAGGALGAPQMGVGGSVSRTRPGDNIAALMRQTGQIQANSALTSGNIWGNAVTQTGAAIGQGLQAKSETQPFMGSFQPTGVSPQQAGINAWQPAPMGRGPQDDWSNWQRYIGTGT